MNSLLGKIHFWGSFVCINGVFFPMFIQGLAGISRRLYDGGAQYAHAQHAYGTNVFMSASAWALFAFQIPFIFNFFGSMIWGKKVGSNPWQSTTLEYAATTSPPLGHGNFAVVPVVHRGPYEYSSPDYTEADFWPQHLAPIGVEPAPMGGGMPDMM